eukprot:TRINITY_DN26638_c1_g1_i2.p1 TRINITY_DN26638_c1_g1~~TRINITY_DN26638_c1_g1_i2.p1  ORF type:complete len:345 (+),score=-5.56 TRINITY_DN26638_c1_g1_i2:32-1066(+)
MQHDQLLSLTTKLTTNSFAMTHSSKINQNQIILFNSQYFNSIILTNISNNSDNKTIFKLRKLSKKYKQICGQSLITAKVDFKGLKNLVWSDFAEQIQYLDISIPNYMHTIDNLRFVSPKYFPNIKKVNVEFTNMTNRCIRSGSVKYLSIKEDLFFRGLNIYMNDFRKHKIQIKATNNDCNVCIIDSKFFGVEISMLQILKVKMQQTNFVQSPSQGYQCQNFSSLYMENVKFQDCTHTGCIIYNPPDKCCDVNLVRVDVENCGANGVELCEIGNFSIKDVNIKNCQCGLEAIHSSGQIVNGDFKNCENYGVYLERSQVEYESIQYNNIIGKNVQKSNNSNFSQRL